jgi:hypothetical protein
VKVWVNVDFLINGSRYYRGQQITMPEGNELTQLLAYGIVSTHQPDGVVT